jgi:hypothetical protein
METVLTLMEEVVGWSGLPAELPKAQTLLGTPAEHVQMGSVLKKPVVGVM